MCVRVSVYTCVRVCEREYIDVGGEGCAATKNN